MNFLKKLTLVANFLTLENCLVDFNEKIPNMESKYQEISQELSKLKKECDNLKTDVKRLQSTKNTLERELKILTDQKEQLTKNYSFQSKNQFYKFMEEHNYELVKIDYTTSESLDENTLKACIKNHIMQFCAEEFLDFETILSALNQLNSLWFQNLEEYKRTYSCNKNAQNNPTIFTFTKLGQVLFSSYYVLQKKGNS